MIGCSAGERKNKKYQNILNNSLKLTILKKALECSTHVPLHIQVKHWVYDIPLTQYHHLNARKFHVLNKCSHQKILNPKNLGVGGFNGCSVTF